MKQSGEKRPAYHRRKDLERLKAVADPLPLLVRDDGYRYVVTNLNGDQLYAGRYQVIHAFISGALSRR
jgi:hypothetical protein